MCCERVGKSMKSNQELLQEIAMSRPTGAFIGASWAVLGIGALAFLIGLWNAEGLALSERGYYFTVLILGLYSAISLQKTIRDKAEGLPISGLYYGISWSVLILSIVLIAIGLWNATMSLSEKGFYGIAFAMSLFAVITIQKNTRDIARVNAVMAEHGYQTYSDE